MKRKHNRLFVKILILVSMLGCVVLVSAIVSRKTVINNIKINCQQQIVYCMRDIEHDFQDLDDGVSSYRISILALDYARLSGIYSGMSAALFPGRNTEWANIHNILLGLSPQVDMFKNSDPFISEKEASFLKYLRDMNRQVLDRLAYDGAVRRLSVKELDKILTEHTQQLEDKIWKTDN